MEALDVVGSGMRMLHVILDRAVQEMTLEQWNFVPSEGGVSPFFLLWHSVRTEDILINDRFQEKDTVWSDGGYDQLLGLPRTGQGTGMTKEQADAVKMTDVGRWHDYQAATWSATESYLASTREDFNRLLRLRRLDEHGYRDERPILDWLWIFCIHGHRHLGEIEYARGLQGLGNLTGR